LAPYGSLHSAVRSVIFGVVIVKVIFTGTREPKGHVSAWQERYGPGDFVPIGSILDILKANYQEIAAEAIVIETSELFYVEGLAEDEYFERRRQSLTLDNLISFVRNLRNLDSCIAMKDGRKWCSIPIVVLITEGFFTDLSIPESLDATVIFSRGDVLADLEKIRQEIGKYRQRLLDELDNLGLLVSYENGRYRVGPALTPRERQVEGNFYFGPADTRPGSRGKYFTVDRDNLGIQFEVEQFEALINKPDVTELDIQQFFEENPHFLLIARLMQALPQVRLPDETGKLLIPDFILKPIVALQRLRDSNWQVLDLKRPQAKLLAGPSDHRRFSSEVFQAITQVKDYRDHFNNPQNTAAVNKLLGHPLKHPRLAVLIGRMPPSSEVELLEREQAREPGVSVVTYDEILERQKGLMA
jgi:antiviral defense system Shedu protein SduA